MGWSAAVSCGGGPKFSTLVCLRLLKLLTSNALAYQWRVIGEMQ